MAVLLPQSVAKEAILALRFSGDEVLPEPEQAERYRNLFKAMVLGNTYKYKVTITFQSKDGVKQVCTTVWGLTAEWVLLKNGIQLPICQIEEVIV